LLTVDSIKQGAAQIVRPYNDLSTVDSSFKISNDLGEEWNITMSHEQLSAIHLPRSGPSLNLYIWLEEFFKFVGDHMPNVGEIHLDNATVKLSVYTRSMVEVVAGLGRRRQQCRSAGGIGWAAGRQWIGA